MKQIRRFEISSILILITLIGVGIFSLQKTVRADYLKVTSSKNSISETALTFRQDFEKNVPTVKSMNALLYMLSGICNSNQVIVGEDDWMFYSSKNDGNPIADFEGTNFYSNEQLENIKCNMLETQNKLKGMGIQFCLIVPPNKENVYSNYMPRKYRHTDITRTDRMITFLQQKGVNAVSPKQKLIKFSKIYKTYYKQDTHWNELGAYIGTRSVLNTFSISVPNLEDSMVKEDVKCNNDLVKIASLRGVFLPDYGLTTSRTLNSVEETQLEEQTVYHIQNSKAEFDKTILLIGDSFRVAMAPNVGYCFKDVYVIHRDNYKKELLDKLAPDYLILEFVERYSEQIETFKIL